MKSLYESILDIDTDDTTNNVKNIQYIRLKIKDMLCDLVGGVGHSQIIVDFDYHDHMYIKLKLLSVTRDGIEQRITNFYKEFQKFQTEYNKIYNFSKPATFEHHMMSVGKQGLRKKYMMFTTISDKDIQKLNDYNYR